MGVAFDLECQHWLAVAGEAHQVAGIMNAFESQGLEYELKRDVKAAFVTRRSVCLGQILDHIFDLVQIDRVAGDNDYHIARIKVIGQFLGMLERCVIQHLDIPVVFRFLPTCCKCLVKILAGFLLVFFVTSTFKSFTINSTDANQAFDISSSGQFFVDRWIQGITVKQEYPLLKRFSCLRRNER